MAYAVYPLDKLPYPVRDNWSYSYQKTFRQSQMDDGQSRARRQWASQPMSHKIMWRMTWEQFAYFEAFLKYSCSYAADWFIMPLYPTQAVQTIRLTKYPTATFNEAQGCWDISGEIEIMRASPLGGAPNPIALPIWPALLPEPEKSGYSIVRDAQITRSNVDTGLARQRVRFYDEVATWQASWFFTQAQFDLFDSFVYDTLYGGLAFFMAPFVNGKGSTLVRAKFLDKPTAVAEGACYRVSAQLVTNQVPGLSISDYLGGNQVLEEEVTFSDLIRYSLTLGALQETITFSDIVTAKLTKVNQEELTFSDDLSTILSGNRTGSEAVAFADVVSYNLQLGAMAEAVAYSAGGSVAWNDYCDGDYCEDNYVGTTTTFS